MRPIEGGQECSLYCLQKAPPTIGILDAEGTIKEFDCLVIVGFGQTSCSYVCDKPESKRPISPGNGSLVARICLITQGVKENVKLCLQSRVQPVTSELTYDRLRDGTSRMVSLSLPPFIPTDQSFGDFASCSLETQSTTG